VTVPDQPKVRVGQIWQSCDPRSRGRQVRIIEVTPLCYFGGNGTYYPQGERFARVERYDPRGGYNTRPGRRSTIRLDRFRPTANGYRLVRQPSERPDEGTSR
jgi:hypothetical protein